jgi:hypothetical protein
LALSFTKKIEKITLNLDYPFKKSMPLTLLLSLVLYQSLAASGRERQLDPYIIRAYVFNTLAGSLFRGGPVAAACPGNG